MKTKFSYLSLLMLASVAIAQEHKTDSIQKLNEVVIVNQNKYKRERSTTVAKMALNNIENPQSYNTVTSELLKEQLVTNFNDALKNATGITRLWESTGRGGDGAEFYTMRGFAVQPTMVNGLPAINNGAIDPINIDNIEVIKGPSGALFGSPLISFGGLINTVTKKPYEKFGGEISYNTGTYGLDRITTDINIPLTDDVSVRVNAANQSENSFQDAGFLKSFFIAPSLIYKVNDRLSFFVNTEFTSRNSANAPMIFLNRNAPLTYNSIDIFENSYKKSYTSNDLVMKNNTFNLQAQMNYKISDKWNSQTVISRSNSQTNGYYHYLYDFANGSDFGRFISDRNGQTDAIDIQQNFTGDFTIGKLRNRLLVGIDYYKSDILNSSTGWVDNGIVSIANQTDTGILTQAGVDNLLINSSEGSSVAESQVVSAYISDVLNITDKFSVMASLRVDEFKGKTNYYSTDEVNGQIAISPKFGAVYQIIQNKVSVFGNYMNGFRNTTPAVQQDNSIKVFDPEHANQYEFGLKTNLFKDVLSATISYYNIDLKNKVLADPTSFINTIQGGEVNSRGFEMSLVYAPIKEINIIAGYSNNKSAVEKDALDNTYVGLRPEEAGPEQLANIWINYTNLKGKWKGFGIGFGGNYASEQITLNRNTIGQFELPSYTILNSALTYNTSKFNFNLKVNNLFNEKYFTGWSTVTPQKLRSLTAGLTFKF